MAQCQNLNEIFKRSVPAFTNIYAATAVKSVSFMLRVIASLKHHSPYRIFWHVRHAMRSALFSFYTTARRGMTIPDRFSATHGSVSTGAFTFCEWTLSFSRDQFNYNQSAISITDHFIVRNIGSFARMIFSQVVHLRNRLNYLVRPAESFTRFFGLSYCSIL